MSPKQQRLNAAALIQGKRSQTPSAMVNPFQAPEPAPTGPTLATVPAPYAPAGEGELTPSEQTDLATCEEAITALQTAFWVAGKALDTIHQARLYRGTHATFAAYVEDVWGMSVAAAYRLVDQWPLAQRLSPISPIGETVSRLPESHVRALLPAAKRLGEDAAVAFYEEAKTVSPNLTAATITTAVKQLPKQIPAGEEAATWVRAHTRRVLAPTPVIAPRQAEPDPEPSQSPEDARRLVLLEQGLAALKGAHRQLRGTVIPDALAADRGRARELIAEVTEIATMLGNLTQKSATARETT